MSAPLVRVGVGVFVLSRHSTHASKFLMGTRLNSLGSGTLALPGGHLEFGESFEECARREVKEETDLDVVDVQFLTAVNSVFGSGAERGREGEQEQKQEGKHYVTVFMTAGVEGDCEAKLMEPGKCEGWEWVGWEEMRGWALAELREMRAKSRIEGGAHTGDDCEGDGDGDGDGLEGRSRSASDPSTKTKHKHRLFLPLLNLVRDRPDMLPRLE
jgi:8-oxo-dGTP diphosphatase